MDFSLTSYSSRDKGLTALARSSPPAIYIHGPSLSPVTVVKIKSAKCHDDMKRRLQSNSILVIHCPTTIDVTN